MQQNNIKKTILKPLYFILFFFSCSFVCFSQYIEGTVIDAITQQPIEGVNVYMEGINRGAVTNEKGNYYLKFPFQIVVNDIIHFTHIAYKNIKIPYQQNKKTYAVNLIPDINKLNEIAVYDKKNLKKTIAFTKLSSIKNAVYGFGSALNDNKLYVFGGDASYNSNGYIKKLEMYSDIDNFDEFLKKASTNYQAEFYVNYIQVYNFNNNSWQKIDSPTLKKSAYHTVNVYQNKFYILGGKWLSEGKRYEYLNNTIQVVDLENNLLEIDKTNPHQSSNAASFIYENYLIVLGGSVKSKSNGNKEYTNKVHAFNFKTGKWFQIATMPIAKEVKGVLINHKIYLIGGYNNKPLIHIETYNLLTEKWEKEGTLFQAISNPAITYNNQIIYFYTNGKISTYNTETKELNEYLIDLFLESAEMYFNNNTLYILGGFKQNSYSLYPSKDFFSIDINQFNTTKIYNSKNL